MKRLIAWVVGIGILCLANAGSAALAQTAAEGLSRTTRMAR